jgi:hypothetical protein
VRNNERLQQHIFMIVLNKSNTVVRLQSEGEQVSLHAEGKTWIKLGHPLFLTYLSVSGRSGDLRLRKRVVTIE